MAQRLLPLSMLPQQAAALGRRGVALGRAGRRRDGGLPGRNGGLGLEPGCGLRDRNLRPRRRRLAAGALGGALGQFGLQPPPLRALSLQRGAF